MDEIIYATSALREQQFSRVLGFLDEQLGDSDVTIVFGDASDGRVYFVSNRPLTDYQKVDGARGGIYVKDAGKPEEWGEKHIIERDLLAFNASQPGYDAFELRMRSVDDSGKVVYVDIKERLPTMVEHDIMSVTGPYAWIYSRTFRDLILHCRHAYRHLHFPEDFLMCHEGAHGIVRKHERFAEKIPENKILEEAVVNIVSTDYVARFHPEYLGGLKKMIRGGAKRNVFPHSAAYSILLSEEQALRELHQEIKKRNLARKALIQ